MNRWLFSVASSRGRPLHHHVASAGRWPAEVMLLSSAHFGNAARLELTPPVETDGYTCSSITNILEIDGILAYARDHRCIVLWRKKNEFVNFLFFAI